ncbi:hypothetical protein D3C81_2039710 [compost metagenome]
MMYCYVLSVDGYTLIDETGVPVGHIIDLDKQILGRSIKRNREPSRWFEGHVYKILNQRKVGA